MDNGRLIELLSRKWAGEASQAELDELYALMEAYPDAVYYEELLWQIWEEHGNKKHDPELSAKFLAHQLKFRDDFTIVPEYQPAKPNRLLKNITFGVLAICILSFVGLYFNFNSNKDRPDIEIVSGKGIRKKLKLPDGTLVWLNSDSKLSYDSRINEKKKRVVHLVGEAFFDVVHSEGRPFIVYTDQITIKVLGTAFNVRAYPADKKSETTLLRGSVELSINDRAQQKIILNPSETVALEEKNTTSEKKGKSRLIKDLTFLIKHIVPLQIGQEEYIEETCWKDNSFVFKNESLEELKPKLERWFNVKIQIESERAKCYHFTGVFKRESIREALIAMQLIKPFTFNLSAHDVIIY